MVRPSLFGPRAGMTYQTTDAEISGTFVMIDSALAAVAASGHNGFVKTATAGATLNDGVVGVVASGVIEGKLGTAADPYAIGAKVNVVKRGIVHCFYDTTEGVSVPARDGLVCIGARGKVKPFTAATITPTMEATVGDTDLGAIITANAGTFANEAAPTVAEIRTYLELIMELYSTELATKDKAYITEFVSEYATAFAANQNSIVGRVVGAPDTTAKVVAVELIGLPSFQEQ